MGYWHAMMFSIFRRATSIFRLLSRKFLSETKEIHAACVSRVFQGFEQTTEEIRDRDKAARFQDQRGQNRWCCNQEMAPEERIQCSHPKTQTMQTANCRPSRPCRLCRPCKLSTFFLTLDAYYFGSSYKTVFNISECFHRLHKNTI